MKNDLIIRKYSAIKKTISNKMGYIKDVIGNERIIQKKWMSDKVLLKGFLALVQLKAFINTLLILSTGIIPENIQYVNTSYFEEYLLIIMFSAYYSELIYDDTLDLLKYYLLGVFPMYLSAIGFFGV